MPMTCWVSVTDFFPEPDTQPLMLDFLQIPGRTALDSLKKLGRANLFMLQVLAGIPELMPRFGLVVNQLHALGVLTLLLICVSGFFVGMVLGLQGFNVLSDFGAEQTLGVMVAASLVRELGPVVTALLFSGRAGSALTAEIGLMKATDQLSGMEMMAVDPLRRIIAPRFLAGCLSMPLLSAVFSVVGIFGGYFVGVRLLGVDEGAFWAQMHARIDFYDDILNGVIKSVVFGIIVTWIAVFEGYDALPTAEGVSRATTRSVVYSAFAILGWDFILTALMFGDT